MVHDQRRSLIVCMTPLQVVIAEKLISKFDNHIFDVIFLTQSDSDKDRFYYNRINKISRNSFYYVEKYGFLGFLHFLYTFKINGVFKDYDNIFVSNIGFRYIQFIVSKFINKNIYTFDDGVANIVQSGIFFSEEKLANWKKIVWRCVGVKCYMNDIKKKSKKHYTIYKDTPNIIENIEFLNIFEFSHSSSEIKKIVNIYLGQPLVEISDRFSEKYIIRILGDLNIDYYFPHPREKVIPKGDFETISTPLIFEDFLIFYLSKNQDVKVNLYSFISSASLNVAHFDRVNVKYIYEEDLIVKYKYFYNLADTFFNVSVVEKNQ